MPTPANPVWRPGDYYLQDVQVTGVAGTDRFVSIEGVKGTAFDDLRWRLMQAALEGEDILLQPVSISFDQLHETAEYADYARGGEKTPEGAEWLYKFIKAQGERNYGKIYVRFPEAVSMRQYLGEPGGPIAEDEAAKRLAMQKMAIDIKDCCAIGFFVNHMGVPKLVVKSFFHDAGNA